MELRLDYSLVRLPGMANKRDLVGFYQIDLSRIDGITCHLLASEYDCDINTVYRSMAEDIQLLHRREQFSMTTSQRLMESLDFIVSTLVPDENVAHFGVDTKV